MLIYLIILYGASLVLSYVVCWDLATRGAVRLMDDEPSITLAGKPPVAPISLAGKPPVAPIGLLHALTPRWVVMLAIFSAAASVGLVAYGWWTYGWGAGSAMSAGFVAALAFNGFVLMPRPESRHYRRLMTPPLLNRHARLVGRSNSGKVEVIEQLLERLGMPIEREHGRPVWLRA